MATKEFWEIKSFFYSFRVFPAKLPAKSRVKRANEFDRSRLLRKLSCHFVFSAKSFRWQDIGKALLAIVLRQQSCRVTRQRQRPRNVPKTIRSRRKHVSFVVKELRLYSGASVPRRTPLHYNPSLPKRADSLRTLLKQIDGHKGPRVAISSGLLLIGVADRVASKHFEAAKKRHACKPVACQQPIELFASRRCQIVLARNYFNVVVPWYLLCIVK